MTLRRSAPSRLELAVEDRFIVVKLALADALLPSGHVLENISDTLASLQPQYTVVCDFTAFNDPDEDDEDDLVYRGAEDVTNDVFDTVGVLLQDGGVLLCKESVVDFAKRCFGKEAPILAIRTADRPLNFFPLDLSHFEEFYHDEDFWDPRDPPTPEEFTFLNEAIIPGEYQSYEDFVRALRDDMAGFSGQMPLRARRATERFVRDSRATRC